MFSLWSKVACLKSSMCRSTTDTTLPNTTAQEALLFGLVLPRHCGGASTSHRLPSRSPVSEDCSEPQGTAPFKASRPLPEELPGSWTWERKLCLWPQSRFYVCALESCCTLGCKACCVANNAEPWVNAPCQPGGSGWWELADSISFLSSAQHDLPPPCSISVCRSTQRLNLLATRCVGYAEHIAIRIASFTARKDLVAVKWDKLNSVTLVSLDKRIESKGSA